MPSCGVAFIKTFRGAVYEVSYCQLQEGGCNHIMEILVDGQKWTETYLPWEYGKTYKVEVRLVK